MVTHYLAGPATKKSIFYFAAFLCVIVYAGSLFFPLMDKDAAHHANIALHMYEHNDYISLIDRGNDYLDKPHLLFWVSAISFKIFGVNTFAHRFPALLFSLLSLYSTYGLARHLSSRTIAWMAMLVLATAQSFMLSVIDARMETPLTAFIIFALWQLILYTDKNRFINLVLASLGTALAFATKGWIGPVIVFISVFFYLLTDRKWNVFSRWKTWLFIPLFFIFISPVLYAYYIQFDLHPEKVIRGENNRPGIRFILWDQLFERAQGFDVKERNSSYFFLFHTFLWAFFPWSIMAYVALVFWIRRMLQKKWRHPFHFAVLSFLFVLFAISFSKFKMPHYIIMLLPLAALFTAPFLNIVFSVPRWKRIFYPLHMFFGVVVLLMAMALNFYFFQPRNFLLWIICVFLIGAFIYLLFRKFRNNGVKVFWISIALSIMLNFILNYTYFPSLMKYQGGNGLVKLMEERNLNIPDDDIILLEWNAHSFDFYRNRNHRMVEVEKMPQEYPSIKDKYFLASPFLVKALNDKGFGARTVISHIDFNVAVMKFKFLNPATREQTLDSLMLVKIYPLGGQVSN